MTATTTAPAAATGPRARPWRRQDRPPTKVNWWLTALMVALSLTILIPLYFAITTSLKTPEEFVGAGFGLPTSPQWSNYADAWRLTNYPRAALNSAIITVGALVLTLLTNSMVAYAISRNLHRRLFRGLFLYFVSALFVPFPIIMLPVVKQTAALNMDNHLGLIFLYTVYGLGFNVLVYVGYLRSIPKDLEEAAAVDGASVWSTFWRVVFPLLAPMNATVGILTVLWAWNDFLLPLVILSSPRAQTLPLVQYVFQGQFQVDYTTAFASYMMALAPMLLVYLVAQRWVISGVMRGSVK